MPQLKLLRYELTAFPALALPVALYALGAFFTGWAEFARALAAPALSLPSPSSVRWTLTWGEILVLAGLIALFADLLKSTSTGRAAVVNHVLSVSLLVICLVLFLLTPAFATSTFFLLIVMMVLDVVAGFTITTISARRDVAFE
jgi:hypothetical protein